MILIFETDHIKLIVAAVTCRYMAEILPIRHIQSINQSILFDTLDNFRLDRINIQHPRGTFSHF